MTASEDLRNEPLHTRRKLLEGIVEGQRLLLPARRLSGSGVEAWREVERRGYEGLVAKDEASLYVGGRTLSWLKVKQAEYGWVVEDSRPADLLSRRSTQRLARIHMESQRAEREKRLSRRFLFLPSSVTLWHVFIRIRSRRRNSSFSRLTGKR
jgi:ATP-dependent DNA ligase